MPSQTEIDLANEMHTAGLLSDVELEAIMAGNTSTLPGEEVTQAENMDAQSDEPVAERVIGDDELEAVTTQIEADEHRQAAYASQDVGATMLTEEEVQAAESVAGDNAPAKPARAPRKASAEGDAPKGKRVSRVTTHGSLAKTAAIIAGDPAMEQMVEKLPKKVQEKAVNYLDWRTNGKTLSVFTKHALDEIAAAGSVSSKRLVEILNGSTAKGGAGYSIGTARSQAQQVMTLLPAMGVCTKANGVLTPRGGVLAATTR